MNTKLHILRTLKSVVMALTKPHMPTFTIYQNVAGTSGWLDNEVEGRLENMEYEDVKLSDDAKSKLYNLFKHRDDHDEAFVPDDVEAAYGAYEVKVWSALLSTVESITNDEYVRTELYNWLTSQSSRYSTFSGILHAIYEQHTGSGITISDVAGQDFPEGLDFDVNDFEKEFYKHFDDEATGYLRETLLNTIDWYFDYYQKAEQHKPGPETDNVVYRYNGSNNSIGGASAKGMYVAELAPEDLAYESDQLGHCIGDPRHMHLHSARMGKTRVFSVRTPVGKVKFTIETDKSGRNINQIKGNSNRLPGYAAGSSEMTKSDEVRLVVDFLINYLKKTPDDIARIRDIRSGVLAMQASGVDPFKPPVTRKNKQPTPEVSARMMLVASSYATLDYHRGVLHK